MKEVDFQKLATNAFSQMYDKDFEMINFLSLVTPPPKTKNNPNKTKAKNNRVSKAANKLSNKVEAIKYILFYFEIVKSKLQIKLRV